MENEERDPRQSSVFQFRRQYSRDDENLPYEVRFRGLTMDNTDLQWTRILSFFLGPKGENEDHFKRLAMEAIERHCRSRKQYCITDERMVTDNIKKDEAFDASMKLMECVLKDMSEKLEQSVPVFSIRYQGHMLWDTAMPANLGYIQALLYNQNNVALEASPVTTDMENTVCKQLCDMIFETSRTEKTKDSSHWGHLTSGRICDCVGGEQVPKNTDLRQGKRQFRQVKFELCIWDEGLRASGSIANIEALWASRNVKFVPLAIKEILLNDPKFSRAKEYKVYLPKLDTEVKLIDQTNWDLLNLDIDDIIKMPKEIAKSLKTEQLESDLLGELKTYSIAELGIHGIMETFDLKKSPVVIAPATSHYSWEKASNVLGLGLRNMMKVEVDERARMDIEDLRKVLHKCLKDEIPVISVVVVIGTTEESAVDPLKNVLEVRDEMRIQGMNFVINADAAWGGYFMTMLKPPETSTVNRKAKEYIPYCDISGHTFQQLKCLHKADTVTVDPHKSGFIPYSAGAICYRNGEMKNFVKIQASVICHEEEDKKAIGIFSLQGSRPGATAAGVLMAHMVIGLHSDGYGRILGQCMFGAKLFYCRWLTLARQNDPFVLVLMKDIPDTIDLDRAQNVLSFLFNSKITNDDIIKNEEVSNMLRVVGPDMLINAFSVNIKGNKDVNLCNRLNKLIFRMLSHSDSHKKLQRTPLILTHSQVDPKVSKRVVNHMKKRLGLPTGTPDSLHFLINTVMNPFVGRTDLVEKLGEIFRQTVLTAIGTLTDEKDVFKFILVDNIKKGKESFFAELLPSFTVKSQQYQAIIKFKFADNYVQEDDIDGFNVKDNNADSQLFMQTVDRHTLGELLEITTCIQVDMSLSEDRLRRRRKIIIEDIPLFQHFDNSEESNFPERTVCFLYGEDDVAHMTRLSRDPDMLQVFDLHERPKHVSQELLRQGIKVHMIEEPRQQRCSIKFNGENGERFTITVKIKDEHFKELE